MPQLIRNGSTNPLEDNKVPLEDNKVPYLLNETPQFLAGTGISPQIVILKNTSKNLNEALMLVNDAPHLLNGTANQKDAQHGSKDSPESEEPLVKDGFKTLEDTSPEGSGDILDPKAIESCSVFSQKKDSKLSLDESV